MSRNKGLIRNFIPSFLQSIVQQSKMAVLGQQFSINGTNEKVTLSSSFNDPSLLLL